MQGGISYRTLPENWHTLGPLERLNYWYDANHNRLGQHATQYKTLLENFYFSCKQPTLRDYLNFELIDIKPYPVLHQALLHAAFCTMYDTTPTCLAARLGR